MTCSKRIFPVGDPMWGLTAPTIGHATECLVLRQAPSQSSHWKSTANLSMLKPSAHVFHEMSICLRSHIWSGACDGAGTQINRPTGGCRGVNRRQAYWLYDAGPPAMLPPVTARGRYRGGFIKSRLFIWWNTKCGTNRHPEDHVSFHVTSRHPQGQQTLKTSPFVLPGCALMDGWMTYGTCPPMSV